MGKLFLKKYQLLVLSSWYICLFLSPIAGRLKGQPVFRNTYPGLGQPKTQEENTIHWYKKREKEV